MDEIFALTIAQAVKATAVSRTELYRAVGRGELVLRKRGRRSLFLAEDLKEWIKSLPSAERAITSR